MTLDELRAQVAALSDIPGNAVVVLAADAAGNKFSPAAEIESALYRAENTWSGDRYMTEEDRLATGNPEDFDQAPDTAVPAVFLWPTH